MLSISASRRGRAGQCLDHVLSDTLQNRPWKRAAMLPAGTLRHNIFRRGHDHRTPWSARPGSARTDAGVARGGSDP